MKKVLLTMSAAVLACAGMSAGTGAPRTPLNNMLEVSSIPAGTVTQNSTRAAGEVEFSYAQAPVTAYGFNNVSKGNEIYLAFQVDPAVLTQLAGNKISAISTYNGINENLGKNPDQRITVFLTNDLGEAPFYEQDFRRGLTAYKKETTVLDAPQSFDPEKPLYVGYHFTYGTNTQYFLVVDDIPVDAPSCYYAINKSSGTPAADAWDNGAPEIGSCCMSVTFSGNNMPDISVVPTGLNCTATSSLNLTPNFNLNVINLGSSNVESLDFHVEATGEQAYDLTYTAPQAITPGTPVSLTLAGHNFTTVGEKQIKITVTKVNGAANPSAEAAATATTLVVETLFPRVALFEVGTGTWCGWCPRSLVALDYIRENYAGKAIGIAYHSGDKMAVASGNAWLNYMGVTGFPTSFVNRVEKGAEPGNDDITPLEKQLNSYIEAGSPCKAEVVNFVPAEDGKTGTVTATYRFAQDVTTANYRVSVVIVEDNVGPYDQDNYYAGGGAGKLFGWESKGSPVSYTYNEVVRYITGVPGKVISTDETLKAGQDYTVDFNVSLSNFINKDADASFRAIAIICNKDTKEVLNADDKEFTKNSSGVNNILADAAKPVIVLGEGSISISNATNVAIYTLDGVKVADGNATGLAKGVYIVKADSMVQKVLVK